MRFRFLTATLFIAVSLAGLSISTSASAQSTPGESLQQALQRLRAGSTDDSIRILDSLVAANPEFAQGWAGLGQAYRQKQEYDASVGAFQQAVDLGSPTPGMLYNLGTAYAYADRPDEAFEWLIKAKETGALDMTAFDGTPAAGNLRNDRRYASLFPSPEEMADPFVEPTRIIHEWIGESRGDQFGWIARNIGDVDGDGVNDMATSAPTRAESGQRAGKIYAYSGRSGRLLWTALGRTVGGRFGAGIESAGDVNADGVPDVVAGAPNTNEVYVFSGSDGAVLLELAGPDPKGAFGNNVKGIGDANGDGFGDILIGEPYQIFGAPVGGGDGSEAGRAHVYSGQDGSVLMTLVGESSGDAFGTAVSGKTVDGTTYFMVGAPNAGPAGTGRVYVYDDLSGVPLYLIDAASTGASLGGMFLSVVGDVNADGTPDMYASDWADGANGTATGRVYIHSGRDGSRLYSLAGEAPGDGFGIGISDAGDADGDGHVDLLIGAWQHAGAAPSGGKLYLHSGKDGSLIRTITGKVSGETLGFDTTGMGDVDGDGTVDFLVTSAWSGFNGFQTGRVFILSGATE